MATDPSNTAILVVAASSFLATCAKWFADHLQERRAKAGPDPVLDKLGAIEEKLDGALERTHTLELVTWGVDKTNGLRGSIGDHETRLRKLERDEKAAA